VYKRKYSLAGRDYRYVIHCLGPVYGMDKPEDELLARCYRNALQLAEKQQKKQNRFTFISCPKGVKMEFLELVKKRRSVRSYTGKPVSRELLLKCVESARLAPSACNVQPWRFVIVDDRKLIVEIAEKACHGVYSINKFIKDAGALVAVISEREAFIRKVGGYLRGTNYYLLDIGIACEHLVLQATELGIGSCWIGWFDENKLKKILNIPRNKKIDIIISLGYYDSQSDAAKPKPRKELSEIASFI